MRLRRAAARARAGFSLLEVVVAMTIFLVILSFSLPFFNSQTRAVSRASGQGDMIRGLQFAIAQLDRDLRMAGAGTYAQQPMLVQIAPLAITFNLNSSSPDSLDVRAVYWDPDADPATQVSMTTASTVILPTSGSKTYPDTNYVIGGILSAAETISYWFSLDSSTARTDDYIMWRRENTQSPTIVVKGVIIPAGTAVFSYVKADTGGNISVIANSSLPRYHNAKLHGSTADTGAFAVIDSVRVVNVTMTGSYDDNRFGSRTQTVTASIRVANSGLVQNTTCGDPPIFGRTVNAFVLTNPLRVVLTWNAAVDETSGERDIEQYAIFRRDPATSVFDEPFASVAAGLASYSYIDTDVQSGDRWVYGVAAMDCSPALSSPSVTATQFIP
jgi:prepilin-type N-terminal cleavage/methylation domain-containing protein